MELLLWRHAEAHDARPGQNDLARPLTSRGEHQAQRVAHWLRAHQPRQLKILVSPALRCQQTASALALPFATEPRIAPHADSAALLAASGWPAEHGKTAAVLLIGHQPTLGRLAALLLAGQETDWSIKKGGLWWFSQRNRDGAAQVVLRAVINPELLEA